MNNSQALQKNKMGTEPIVPLIIKMSLPAMFSMLIQALYNVVDSVFLGYYGQGSEALTAVSLAYPLQLLLIAFVVGTGVGINSLIARRLGEGDVKNAQNVAMTGIILGVATWVIFALMGIFASRPFITFMAGSENTQIIDYGVEYIFIVLVFSLGIFIQVMIEKSIQATGNMIIPMASHLIGAVTNIVLDPILIFGLGPIPSMGVKGAAIATAASQVISFSVAMSFYILGKGVIKISPKFISRNLKDYYLIIKTGIPTVFRQGLGSVATALLNVRVKIYGDAAVAAVCLANKVYILIRSVILGVGHGFQPVAGYNYGAKRYSRVKKAFVWATVFGTVVAVTGALCCATVPQGIIRVLGASNPQVAKIGGRLLLLYSIELPLLGFSSYVNMMYQSLGFVKGATFLASCRQGVFFIPLILVLPTFLGMNGVLLSQPIADFLTFVTSVPFCVWFMLKVLKEN